MKLPEFNTNVIAELLSWIEDNLENPLVLDDVARRAGYSKWHLQRTFKNITGMPLGGYIRSRRLCRSAIALRLTKQSILNIAVQYQFDSQQTFTRRFKAHFNITPAAYRRSASIDLSALQPPLDLRLKALPVPVTVDMPALALRGTTYYYSCPLEEAGQTHAQIRKRFWESFTKNMLPPQTCYALTNYRAGDSEQDVNVSYTIAAQEVSGDLTEDIVIPAGKYLCFHYQGPLEEYLGFALKIYMYVLPAMGVVRREGQDIECFHTIDTHASEPPRILSCDFMIPIVG